MSHKISHNSQEKYIPNISADNVFIILIDMVLGNVNSLLL